ncbi:MAG: hypothetical protein B0D92_04700 [Spirochaeta sp. LUC14_002_19_P3]|nr:MAG: hypothetical protein B0D92_04700 [Spirochaeta sp. LUC14_002_19_P3]
MEQQKIGISDIGLYLPHPRMGLDSLLKSRAVSHPELIDMLTRAIEKTDLTAFRFPAPWEDSASLAANAAAAVLNTIKPRLRALISATETAVDHSKPIAAYVQGMLERAAYGIGRNLATFEVKHACAGGTAALLAGCALLQSAGDFNDQALVLCSDISRYEAPSSAEITQGAGAAALLVEKNPRLLELDLRPQGYYSSDVDDFFRPLGSTTAKVKGGYSMKCYQDALIAAFEDYCSRLGRSPRQVLDETHYVALHVPFPRMPEAALTKLLSSVYGRDKTLMEGFLRRTGFLEAMYLNRETGNLYTVSLYAYIAALLHREWQRLGHDLIGKRLLMASYGSGNTMIVFSATVAPGAPEVISRWNFDALMKDYQNANFQDYLNWLALPRDYRIRKNLLEGANPRKGMFYLRDFTETGFRIYDRA